MQTERRMERRRMDIAKRVEILPVGDLTPFSGMTTNLSNTGLCGFFDSAPEPGRDVTLRVFWDDDMVPVERVAHLVWTSPDVADGRVRVGLEVENRAPDAAQTSPHPVAPPEPLETRMVPGFLEKGGVVWLNVGGMAIETMVSSVGAIRANHTVEVVLAITDPAFVDAPPVETHDVLPPEEEMDCSAHPFRDMYRATQKYGGPVVSFAAKYLGIAFHLLFVAAAWLWRKTPAKVRTPVEARCRRIAAAPRIVALYAILSGWSARIKRRLAASKRTAAPSHGYHH